MGVIENAQNQAKPDGAKAAEQGADYLSFTHDGPCSPIQYSRIFHISFGYHEQYDCFGDKLTVGLTAWKCVNALVFSQLFVRHYFPRLETALMQSRTFTLGHSPDPDDAFMFYGLAKGLIPTPGFKFEHILQDIQTL